MAWSDAICTKVSTVQGGHDEVHSQLEAINGQQNESAATGEVALQAPRWVPSCLSCREALPRLQKRLAQNTLKYLGPFGPQEDKNLPLTPRNPPICSGTTRTPLASACARTATLCT